MANTHFLAYLYGMPLDFDNKNGGWQVGGILNPPIQKSLPYQGTTATVVSPPIIVGIARCNSIITVLPTGLSRNGIPESYFSDLIWSDTPPSPPTVLYSQYYSNDTVNDGIYRIYANDGTTVLYETFFSFMLSVTVDNATPAAYVIFNDGNDNAIDITANADVSNPSFTTYYYQQTSGIVSRSAGASVIVTGTNGGVTTVDFDTTGSYRGLNLGSLVGGTSITASDYQGIDGASDPGGINSINTILLNDVTSIGSVSPQGNSYKCTNTSLISPNTELNWNAVNVNTPLANQSVQATPTSGSVSITFPVRRTTTIYILFAALDTGLHVHFTDLILS